MTSTSTYKLLLAVAVLPAFFGCAFQSGERAGGDCPAGEICSSEVTGLDFSGTAPSGYLGNIVATAEGGTQTIDIHGWTRPYSAVAGGSAFEVVGTTNNHVSVRGLSAGASRLRILHPTTGELLDRTDLEVKRIARIGLAEPNYLTAPIDSSAALAFLAGADGQVVVRLHDEVDDLIVDEGLEISITGGVATRNDGWDTFTVTAPSSGSVAIGAVAAGTSASFELPVVAAIDAIEIASGGPTGGASVVEVELGGGAILCFRGLSGVRHVLGARFTYAVAGSVGLSGGAADEAAACTIIEGISLGNGNVIASGSTDVTLAVPVRVVEAVATGGASGGLTSDISLAYTPGERR